MDAILVLLIAVALSMIYLLAKAPGSLDDPADDWDAVPVIHHSRPAHSMKPKGKHGDRRYHDVDHPYHRRRTDGPATD
jgi:hypothetical protein